MPAADPEVSLFLHGPDRSPATVQIVWRADLELDRRDFNAKTLLAAMPPKSAEAVEVSLAAARRRLRRGPPTDFSDAPGREQSEDGTSGSRPAFRWAGPDSDRTKAVHANELHPNDLIVVPCDYGGCDQFGWNPDSDKRVEDVAAAAAEAFAARRYALRLAPDLIRAAAPPGDDNSAAAEAEKASTFAKNFIEVIANWRDGTGRRRVRDLVGGLLDADPPQRIAELLELLKSPRRGAQAIFPYGADTEGGTRGVVLFEIGRAHV